ncbi:MAG TPA: mechanosensitive ion channel domain-containing protein [Gemmatimonadales bacterium]|nr:mechanosensitive ion channel domain-containing protein [Gemmatimonadales bacterium]HSB70063.1 mechanosensitive ion channel domain-containing protein [Candidatus Methylomirabilis sp.]
MNWFTQPLISIGSTRVSPASLALFVVVVAGVVFGARTLGTLVGSRLLARTSLDRGLQYAVGRMTYYTLLVLGLMIALQTSGIEVGSVTVILGALGVGIGFGLQNIVNNFVSGLILLVERPVQHGDWIEVDRIGGRVERIGARSTIIVTSDNITMIIPNADLITRQIINWSHGDPTVRFRVPVGVAYGSDIDRVRQALLEVAVGHPGVLRDPPPTVFFTGFGDSALNLELVVWSRDMVQTPLRFRSDLNFAIDAAFRRHGIQVPFPQRDLHLKSGRVPASLPAPEPDAPKTEGHA